MCNCVPGKVRKTGPQHCVPPRRPDRRDCPARPVPATQHTSKQVGDYNKRSFFNFNSKFVRLSRPHYLFRASISLNIASDLLDSLAGVVAGHLRGQVVEPVELVLPLEIC